MSKWGCALLVLLAASTQVAEAVRPHSATAQTADPPATPSPVTVPTVTIVKATPVVIPTVRIPQPVHHQRKRVARRLPKIRQNWIWAYLTSYCPGSAGWLSSSGASVFYGMLANNYYAFGTRVYLPVLGETGVVEDRMAVGSAWDQFDVWSAVCYSTPTGWFKVAVLRG